MSRQSHATLIYGNDSGVKDSALKTLIEKIKPKYIHEFGRQEGLKIDEVREIKRRAMLISPDAPQLFLLFKADTMSTQAANALLKILEEPPSSSIFILQADSLRGISSTILSRISLVPYFSGDTNTIEGEDDAELFFASEIKRLRNKLVTEDFKKPASARSIVERLKLGLKLSGMLSRKRTAAKYLRDVYHIQEK